MRPADVKCVNCIFFEERKSNCHRLPARGNDYFRIRESLAHIHWVLSRGGEEYTDKESLEAIDPDNPYTYEDFPYVRGDDWCGEFRREWPLDDTLPIVANYAPDALG